jgi:hypothetical protein
MHALATVARWETIGLVAAFGIVTLWRLFQTASFSGLLCATDGSFSPARAQMLVLTTLTALQYLLTTMHNPSHLPPVPGGLLMMVGGSHAIYLGAKAWGFFGPNKQDMEDK